MTHWSDEEDMVEQWCSVASFSCFCLNATRRWFNVSVSLVALLGATACQPKREADAPSSSPAEKAEPAAEIAQARPIAARGQLERRYPLQQKWESVGRPWLGLYFAAEKSQPTDSGEHEGLLLADVVPDSPAYRAGLQAGDRLLQFAGKQLKTPSDLTEAIDATPVGASRELLLEREGELRSATARLDALPESEDRVRLSLQGRKAPSFQGAFAFQGEIASPADAQGKVLLLDFWASYCPLCLHLMPKVAAIARRYSGQGVEVVGITVDIAEVARKVATDQGLRFSLLSDPEAEVMNRYFANEIPLLVLIDQEGFVVDVLLGGDEERLHALQTQLDSLLAAQRK